MSNQEHPHRTRGKSSQQVSCIKPAPLALTDPRRAFHYSDLLTRQIYCRTIVADHRDLNDPDVTPFFTKGPPSAQGCQVEVICTCLHDLHCAFSVSPFTGGSLRAAAHKVTEDHAVLAQGGQVGVTPTFPHDARTATILQTPSGNSSLTYHHIHSARMCVANSRCWPVSPPPSAVSAAHPSLAYSAFASLPIATTLLPLEPTLLHVQGSSGCRALAFV